MYRNGREVKPDRHYHGAGNHRRHQTFDPARADFHHQQADEHIERAAGDDSAERDAEMRVESLTVEAGYGDHHADKGRAGTEIARHASAGDNKKEQGADA